MNRMMPAPGAELLGLQTLGLFLLIFRRRIVALFAVGALQRDDVSHTCFATSLRDDVGNGAGADGAAAFANRESQPLLQRHRRDQLDRQRHVVARHHHLHPFRQFRRTRHVRRPKVKLRPVSFEERRVPPALFLRQERRLPP